MPWWDLYFLLCDHVFLSESLDWKWCLDNSFLINLLFDFVLKIEKNLNIGKLHFQYFPSFHKIHKFCHGLTFWSHLTHPQLQHCSALLSIARHCSILLSIVQNCSALFRIAQHWSVLLSIDWHCSALISNWLALICNDRHCPALLHTVWHCSAILCIVISWNSWILLIFFSISKLRPLWMSNHTTIYKIKFVLKSTILTFLAPVAKKLNSLLQHV